MFFGHTFLHFLLMLQVLVPHSNGEPSVPGWVPPYKCFRMRAGVNLLRGCDTDKYCCPEPEMYLPHVTCGKSRTQPTKGREPVPNEFPWMAMLLYGHKYNTSEKLLPKCGGSLINNWHVLTAAHCVEYPFVEYPFALKSVRLGEHDTSTNPDLTVVNGISRYTHRYLEIEVDKIIAHEQFNHGKKMINDIALLRLQVPVRYTEAIQPICIPGPHITSSHKRMFQASGWSDMGKGIPSQVLLRSFIPERHPDVCKSNDEFDFGSQICAGGLDGNYTRRGDSGGPLMETVIHENVRVTYASGIVSYRPKTCQQNICKPAFYTKTAYFFDWINSKLQSALIDSGQK
ncbi:melanization protease 1 [Drosophila yakuba]|uniref:Peptidase S1 domain-containing protein n=1 Tax=Drosophila yakuba TaxID=7245 RepID=B4PQ06_DROYA|nr:melanization protease 1 [Drosophila yakuba]EDW97233.2 uncharacterized protein Dyak_GE26269 [Drosophila yakuba]